MPETNPSLTMAAATAIWPIWKLSLLLYPFAVVAVWINLFMAALLTTWLGLPMLSPWGAAAASVVLGIPAGWASGRWVRTLLDRAA